MLPIACSIYCFSPICYAMDPAQWTLAARAAAGQNAVVAPDACKGRKLISTSTLRLHQTAWTENALLFMGKNAEETYRTELSLLLGDVRRVPPEGNQCLFTPKSFASQGGVAAAGSIAQQLHPGSGKIVPTDLTDRDDFLRFAAIWGKNAIRAVMVQPRGPPGKDARGHDRGRDDGQGTPVDSGNGAGVLQAGAQHMPAPQPSSHPISMLYLFTSMLNHSCEPNVAWVCSWNKAEQCPMLTVYPLRDIEAGEELTVSYLGRGPQTGDAAARKSRLRQWGFDCVCPRCASPTDDTVAIRCTNIECTRRQLLGSYCCDDCGPTETNPGTNNSSAGREADGAAGPDSGPPPATGHTRSPAATEAAFNRRATLLATLPTAASLQSCLDVLPELCALVHPSDLGLCVWLRQLWEVVLAEHGSDEVRHGSTGRQAAVKPHLPGGTSGCATAVDTKNLTLLAMMLAGRAVGLASHGWMGTSYVLEALLDSGDAWSMAGQLDSARQAYDRAIHVARDVHGQELAEARQQTAVRPSDQPPHDPIPTGSPQGSAAPATAQAVRGRRGSLVSLRRYASEWETAVQASITSPPRSLAEVVARRSERAQAQAVATDRMMEGFDSSIFEARQ